MRRLIPAALAALLLAAPALASATIIDEAPETAAEEGGAPEVPDSGIDPGEDPGGWLTASYEAVRGGEWLLAAALGVIGLVFVARRFGGSVWPALKTDRGGVALAGATALLGGVAHAVAAGDGLSLALAADALAVAVAAMGGYAGIRKLLVPKE